MGSNTVLLEQCEVAPNGGAAEKSLPLLDFDLIFLRSPVVQIAFFYGFQCSKSHFLDKIVPNLKNSLSTVLNHYSPLAGTIVLPLSSGTPVSHYVAGDSVSVSIAQSDADFDYLTANHYRDADHFCGFVPKLPRAAYLSDSIRFRLAAFQFTLFPNQGICIGVTIHHSIADGAALMRVLQAWSLIFKFKGDSHLGEECLPFYDRSGINDAQRTWTTTEKSRRRVTLATVTPPTHNVRAVFVLSDDEIQHLKKFILNKKPDIAAKNVSSFIIICAYVWTCLANSDEVADDEPQYLACPSDCRARLDPPLPDTYFGNCVAYMLAESTHGKLRGKEGIIEAALAIGKAIQKTFPGEKGVIDFSGNQEFRKSNRRRVLIIAGSPRYDMDGIDFGWGRSRKTEFVHIDSKKLVSLISKSVDLEGVQIGLSMSKVEMDAFAAVFEQGIRESTQEENISRSRI